MNMTAVRQEDRAGDSAEGYSTSDLPNLRTSCQEEPQSSVSLGAALLNPDNLASFLKQSNIESIRHSLDANEALVFSFDELERLATEGIPEGVDRIYLLRGNYQFPEEVQGYISEINRMKCEVIPKTLAASLVATDGQFNHLCGVYSTNSVAWMLMVVADNHDLYKEHHAHAAGLASCHLVVPHTAPALHEGLSSEVSRQMREDTTRFINLTRATQAKIRNRRRFQVDLKVKPISRYRVKLNA